MKRINCKKPSKGLFLCATCIRVGDRNEQMLEDGIVVSFYNPKTKAAERRTVTNLLLKNEEN